jgi:hypothetical protein
MQHVLEWCSENTSANSKERKREQKKTIQNEENKALARPLLIAHPLSLSLAPASHPASPHVRSRTRAIPTRGCCWVLHSHSHCSDARARASACTRRPPSLEVGGVDARERERQLLAEAVDDAGLVATGAA